MIRVTYSIGRANTIRCSRMLINCRWFGRPIASNLQPRRTRTGVFQRAQQAPDLHSGQSTSSYHGDASGARDLPFRQPLSGTHPARYTFGLDRHARDAVHVVSTIRQLRFLALPERRCAGWTQRTALECHDGPARALCTPHRPGHGQSLSVLRRGRWLYAGRHQRRYPYVTYLDQGNDSWRLEYDAVNDPFK